ncbi:MAG: Holliday junction branch migration protein RuvA [Clostridia bacterium]|nr:Holliday junction branch migration protein RuvA [Clostridia bacterium]
MFYYIKGKLVTAAPGYAVIDAMGVAYKLTVSENTYRALPPRHSVTTPPDATLYTYLAVREDGIELYGFINESELSSFKMLISVSGVGPKAAMSILSQLTPERFALAVCTDDKKAISAASGIGPKTAARIILELKDKLSKQTEFDLSAAEAPVANISPTAARGKLSEAQDALIVLGYTRGEAQNVLKNIDTDSLPLEDIIKEALKRLMRS